MADLKLKCIGGPSAGKVVSVPEHYREVRVSDPLKISVLCGPLKGVPEMATTKTTIYVRNTIQTVGEEFAYLAPFGLSAQEQIAELLAGYRP